METITYASYNKNDKIRRESSSGGIFYELAKWAISQGGIVCGAKFDTDWNVVHDCAETLEDAMAFMKSKYVQSNMENVFCQIKDFLDCGRYVLFSGTPCQVAGLKSFLNKDYKKLITVDFVCHGVPSRKVWREYLEFRSNGKNISNVNFRDKAKGWLKYSLKIDFSDGNVYQETQQNDLYMKGFLQDVYLRPSCYACKFKGIQRDSDITLADLWGCQEILPEIFDDKGTSLVLIQSEQGNVIWDAIAPEIQRYKFLTNDYLKFNPSLLTSVSQNKKREKYFKKSTWKNLEKLTSGTVRVRFLNILQKCKHALQKRRKGLDESR